MDYYERKKQGIKLIKQEQEKGSTSNLIIYKLETMLGLGKRFYNNIISLEKQLSEELLKDKENDKKLE